MADRKAVTGMRMAISGALGGLGELLASVVELCETQHPHLWEASPEQLLLTEQLRASQRLVHMLGHIQNDFAGMTASAELEGGAQAGGLEGQKQLLRVKP